jgi:hypothetical protein
VPCVNSALSTNEITHFPHTGLCKVPLNAMRLLYNLIMDFSFNQSSILVFFDGIDEDGSGFFFLFFYFIL